MIKKAFVSLLAVATALAPCGCAFFRSGNTARIQPRTNNPRAGQVIILRGLTGAYSVGMDDLGKRTNDAGIEATVFQFEQWAWVAAHIAWAQRRARPPEPLVIMGHSYGADNAVRIAKLLEEKHVQVDLLITVDPVTPPPVSPNVKVALDFYQSRGVTDNLPWWRGIPLKREPGSTGELENYNLSENRRDLLVPHLVHTNMPSDLKMQDEIMQWILKTCPLRAPLQEPAATR
jgi:pimeloyl-ACP methyl ester carboxylesterase